MDYKLQLTYLSKKECQRINSIISTAVLLGLRLNQHMPRAVVYELLEYGGMEMPEVYTRGPATDTELN